MIPKKRNNKPLIAAMAVIYVLVALLACHTAKAMNPLPEETTMTGITSLGGHSTSKTSGSLFQALQIALEEMPSAPFAIFPLRMSYLPSVGLITLIFVLLVLYSVFRREANDQTMHKNQNGSSEWNTNYKGFAEAYGTSWINKEETEDPNIILSKHLKLGMRIAAIENQRNANLLITGGAGTGKSFRLIKPNIMQMNSSIMVTDPSGELLECCGKSLIENGVMVKVFSTSDMVHSNCYNPFDYVYDEEGVVDEAKVSTLIYLFLKNANGAKEKSSDPFWEKSAKALLSAIAYYMLENKTVPKDSIGFPQVLQMIQLGKVNEDSASSKSPLDKLMEEEAKMAAQEGRLSKAVSNYKTFKLAPPKTANSILITCAVDLQLFDNEKVKNLTRTDFDEPTNNLRLDELCDEKTALFINIPQANGTFDFLVAMLYSQVFDALYTKGEKISPNRFMILDQYKEPLLTMIKTEEEAHKLVEELQNAIITKRTTKRGAEFYQIKCGKKVLREVMSEAYAKRVISHAKHAKVVAQKIRLPFDLRCLMDEFANIGEIPDFPKRLATMRKYGISCAIVLQSITQLKEKYEKNWEGIIGNCDTFIFLGSKEVETCKYVSTLLGKATIVVKNRGRSIGAKGGNASQNYNHSARALLDEAEISKLDNRKCIVIIRGLQPFYDDKYDFFQHPKFARTGDADPENKLKGDILDAYFNSVPLKKPKPKKKKIQQILPIEAKVIHTKQELLETVGSKTDEEFLEKVSSTPSVHIPKPKAKAIVPAAASATQPKPTDESSTFLFGV